MASHAHHAEWPPPPRRGPKRRPIYLLKFVVLTWIRDRCMQARCTVDGPTPSVSYRGAPYSNKKIPLLYVFSDIWSQLYYSKGYMNPEPGIQSGPGDSVDAD